MPSVGQLCGCDGIFLSPQANGHVSQDQEEPVYLERTARAHAEDETQVGPVGSVPPPLLSPLFSPGPSGRPHGGEGRSRLW